MSAHFISNSFSNPPPYYWLSLTQLDIDESNWSLYFRILKKYYYAGWEDGMLSKKKGQKSRELCFENEMFQDDIQKTWKGRSTVAKVLFMSWWNHPHSHHDVNRATGLWLSSRSFSLFISLFLFSAHPWFCWIWETFDFVQPIFTLHNLHKMNFTYLWYVKKASINIINRITEHHSHTSEICFCKVKYFSIIITIYKSSLNLF